MDAGQQEEHKGGMATRLMRTRTATRIFVLVERFWPRILPFLLIVALFLTISWFGLFRLMPDGLRIGIMAAMAALGAASLLGLRYVQMPGYTEVDRRIETANRLAHAPLSALSDKPSNGDDPMAEALWREHQERMARRIGPLEADLPRTGIPARDPFALRALVTLFLVTGFAYSFGPFGGRIVDGFQTHSAVETVPPRIDAWVTPPAYTGRAPVFLTARANAEETAFTIPAGSELTLRVIGGSGAEIPVLQDGAGNETPVETISVNGKPAQTARQSWRQFHSVLQHDGVLQLRDGETEIRSWTFLVTPDEPPTIRFADEPRNAVNGTLELIHEMEDDYGPASAAVEFERDEKLAADARPLYEAPEMPLSLPRRGSNKASKTTRDLTEHPWAGTRVRLTLTVTDDADQIGRSKTKIITLPERPFTNPLAKALVEQRQIIALDANRKNWALELMDAITLRPEDTIDNKSHYLAIMSARTRLKMAHEDEDLREVVDYLWEIARGIEDGDLTEAEKRLRAAQEALKRALEEGASDEEIERLVAELRDAMQDFLREFAERAQQNPSMSSQLPQDGRELRERDLDSMLDQIEQLAKSGSRDKARELLAQMENMFNNLQAGRHQQQQGDSQQNQMREQMNQLGELMRRQQELMNKTFRQNQQRQNRQQRGQQQGRQQQPGDQQGGQPQDGQNPGQQNGQGGMTAEEFAEALRQLQEGQGQLRGDLGEFTEGLEGMGIDPGQEFGEAGEAMGKAGDALGEGDGGEAVGQQGRALEALRQGAESMMQQMQQAMQGENGGSEPGGRANGSDLDPLGRPRASSGPDFDRSVKVPDEIDVQRARQILEAIRKRLGESLAPELEKDYLERLLDLQ